MKKVTNTARFHTCLALATGINDNPFSAGVFMGVLLAWTAEGLITNEQYNTVLDVAEMLLEKGKRGWKHADGQ